MASKPKSLKPANPVTLVTPVAPVSEPTRVASQASFLPAIGPTTGLDQAIIDAVTIALALAWAPKGKTMLHRYLHMLDFRHARGALINMIELQVALDYLAKDGHITRTDAGIALTPAMTIEYGAKVLSDPRINKWRNAVFLAENFQTEPRWGGAYMHSASQAATIVRLMLYAGTVAEWNKYIGNNTSRFVSEALNSLLRAPFDAGIWELVQPAIRDAVLNDMLAKYVMRFDGFAVPYMAWAVQRLQTTPGGLPEQIRYRVTECLVLQGKANAAEALLAGDFSPFAISLRAAMAATRSLWLEASTVFELVFKQLQEVTGGRKHLLPINMAWLYPLSLIAQGGPEMLGKARKFCLSEQGSRTARVDGTWGMWSSTINMRMGDAPADYRFLVTGHLGTPLTSLWELQNCLLRTWVNKPAFTGVEIAEVTQWVARLRAIELDYLADQLQSCLNLANGETPLPGFFVSEPVAAWRESLASIVALDQARAKTGGAKRGGTGEASRLLWDVEVAKSGEIVSIWPLQQKRNARGDAWNKATGMSLSTLAKSEKIDSLDANVVRHVMQAPYTSQLVIAAGDAALALIGHPRVVINGKLDHLVQISAGNPQLEVMADKKTGVWKFVLRPLPPRIAAQSALSNLDNEDFDDDDAYYARYHLTDVERRQKERARLQCMVIDGPEQARLVRFTPAQMRVAQIVSDGLNVPLEAQAEMAAAMKVLAAHFELHSEADLTEAARMLPTPDRLRAEITPHSSGLALRLVVAPFGTNDVEATPGTTAPNTTGTGMRLVAGAGRSRVVMKINDETVGVERDLANETALAAAVIQAIDDAGIAWEEEHEQILTRDPQSSLALLEVLPTLPQLAALDWPKGKAVTVRPVTAKQVKLVLQSRQNWFAVDATVQIDENQVMRLAELLPLLGNGHSRFIQLAPDRYMALTTQLRRQLDDLAALVSHGGATGTGKRSKTGELELSQAGALWLAEELGDWATEPDKAVAARMAALRRAFDSTPVVPAALQATLRDYQATGVQWLQRLGAAGFGACLADDMGLGKTVQTLAVLLDRSAGGPTLVIAPTSLIGNWMDEAARFAPDLRVSAYGQTADEDTRRAIIAAAGPGDVVLATYSLMQIAQADFSAKTWNTVVLDEAQAIKNAAALRSQAVFSLQANFRIALSGTPVENRLEELWSIMRFLNPGLLGSSEQFGQRFVGPIIKEQGSGIPAAESTLRRLKRLISPFLLRRTKAQVLTDLPERTEIILHAELDPEERSHYELLRRRALDTAQQAGGAPTARFKVLAELMRLRRAACDPRLVSDQWPAVGAKVKLFAKIAQDLAAGQHRTLVFSQFTGFLALLGDQLKELGFAYQYLDGGTPANDRAKRVAAFQAGEGQFFLISLKAGGYGLNLTAADYVVIADPWWNPAAEDQAMGRAHRIGQRRPVTAYRLVARGTIEERIVEMHASKRALADGLLEGGDGANAVASVDELLALLQQ